MHESEVGGAEWPSNVDKEMSFALSLCDSGLLMGACWHPLRRFEALRNHHTFVPPPGMTHERWYGKRPPRVRSRRPRTVAEQLCAASIGAGIAMVDGQLGHLRVHAGLRLATRAHETDADISLRPNRSPSPAKRPGHGHLRDAARTQSSYPSRRRHRVPLVAHVAWTAGERFAVTGDNQQTCLLVWQRRECTAQQ